MPARPFLVQHPLVRLFALNTAIGFALAGALVAILMAYDVAGLRTLMHDAHASWVAATLLWFFSGLTFASAQTGIAVMSLGADDSG